MVIDTIVAVEKSDSMNWLPILIGAGAGLLTGVIGGLMVYVLQNRWKLRSTTKGIIIESIPKISEGISIRIKNKSPYPLNQVAGYLTIYKSNEFYFTGGKDYFELLTGITNTPFKHEGSLDIENEKVCWSTAGNPVHVDFCSEEYQNLDLMITDRKKKLIDVASEKGFSTNGGQSRAFLNLRSRYFGIITIVSKDSRAKSFNIEIRPQDKNLPVRLNPSKFYDPNLTFDQYHFEDLDTRLKVISGSLKYVDLPLSDIHPDSRTATFYKKGAIGQIIINLCDSYFILLIQKLLTSVHTQELNYSPSKMELECIEQQLAQVKKIYEANELLSTTADDFEEKNKINNDALLLIAKETEFLQTLSEVLKSLKPLMLDD